MYRFVASAFVVLLLVTVVTSEEFMARITKFEDGKITFTKVKFGMPDEKSEEQTLQLAKKAKFMKAKFNKEDKKFEADGELEGGKDAFAKQVEEAKAKKGKFGPGLIAQVITKGEGEKARVTEIRIFAFKFKKKTD